MLAMKSEHRVLDMTMTVKCIDQTSASIEARNIRQGCALLRKLALSPTDEHKYPTRWESFAAKSKQQEQLLPGTDLATCKDPARSLFRAELFLSSRCQGFFLKNSSRGLCRAATCVNISRSSCPWEGSPRMRRSHIHRAWLAKWRRLNQKPLRACRQQSRPSWADKEIAQSLWPG